MTETKREEKSFFYTNTESGKIQKVTGYSTPYDDYWWCTEIMFSCHVGTHLFNTEEEAKKSLIDYLEVTIKNLQDKLRELK